MPSEHPIPTEMLGIILVGSVISMLLLLGALKLARFMAMRKRHWSRMVQRQKGETPRKPSKGQRRL